jgi:hypothetical protein
MPEIRTLWWCDNCGAGGDVTSARDVGVYEVFDRIRQAHAAAPTGCPLGIDRVRVSLDDEPAAVRNEAPNA